MSNGRAFSNGIKQRRFERNCRSGAVCLKEGIKAGQSIDVIERDKIGHIAVLKAHHIGKVLDGSLLREVESADLIRILRRNRLPACGQWRE